MKKMMSILLMGGFLVGSAGVLMAATGSQTFTVSATVPSPTSVSITADSINSVGTPVFTPVSGTALNFDPLTFDTTNGIYIPNHYFAIGVGPTAGAGTTSATVTYTEGSNPNSAAGGSGHGLGWKTEATFVKLSGSTETVLGNHGKKLLKSVSGESITGTELGSGTLRIYLGIVTNPTAAGEPAGAEVFSAADKTGSYNGQLLVSATVV